MISRLLNQKPTLDKALPKLGLDSEDLLLGPGGPRSPWDIGTECCGGQDTEEKYSLPHPGVRSIRYTSCLWWLSSKIYFVYLIYMNWCHTPVTWEINHIVTQKSCKYWKIASIFRLFIHIKFWLTDDVWFRCFRCFRFRYLGVHTFIDNYSPF